MKDKPKEFAHHGSGQDAAGTARTAALDDKARLPWGSMVMPGILAGVYIGLGGLFATVALARVG